MIKKLIEYKKYKDLYSFKSIECRLSIIITICFILMTNYIDLYKNLDSYMDGLKNMSIYIAAGLLAMIGIVLAGIALILSLLDKEFRQSIKSALSDDAIDQIMLSFEFLTLNIAFGSILYFFIYFLLFTKIYVYKYIFYTLLFIVTYYFLFIVFYTVALVSNSIRLFKIKGMYEDSYITEKSIYEHANEIRIEYLMIRNIEESKDGIIKKIIKKNKISSYNDIINDLDNIVDLKEGISIERKRMLKNYFREYYKK